MGASVRPQEDPTLRLRYYQETGQHDEAKQYEAYLRDTGQLAAPEPERPGLLSRVGQNVTGAVRQMVSDPIGTAKDVVAAPVRSFVTAMAPGVGEARHSAALSKGGNSSGRPIDTTPYDAAHGGVTGGERTAAAAQTFANLLFPSIAGGVSGRAVSAGLPAFAGRVAGMAAGGGVAGAAYSPDDPVAGGLTGAILAPAIGETVRGVGAAGGRGVTALALRPSGRSAPEMARDAATMRAPVGPESATPVADIVTEAAPPPRPTAPTKVERVRAAFGRKAEQAGVESAKTVALRLFGDRAALDNMAPTDALAYARAHPDKPIAALDFGGGNVAGLARTAKEAPGLGRRIIPNFLRERSAGSGANEGATLQRITADFEKRIGLKPEDYFKTADEMATEQKTASKVDYDKVRNLVIDDPEVLSLFDIPEFQSVHESVARAERIRPNGTTIKPLSEAVTIGGEKARVQNAQTLGTLDKMRQYVGEVARGKLESKAIDRNTARAMLERLDAATARLDELHPDYGKARRGYRGRAEAMDAFEQGKADGYTDPRLVTRKLEQMPEAVRDLYRRGQYDALRARLLKMKDGRNIGAWLEENPDIRARVAALAKSPEDATALRGDLGPERAMGDRKDAILGGPNTAERLIEHWSTKPMVTHVGNLARKVPLIGDIGGTLIDNQLSRRFSQQTGDVMGEVAKILTTTGPVDVEALMAALEKLRADDATKALGRSNRIGRATGITVGTANQP